MPAGGQITIRLHYFDTYRITATANSKSSRNTPIAAKLVLVRYLQELAAWLVVGAKGGKSVRYFDVEGRAGGSRAAFWVRPFRDSDVAGIPNPRECKNFLLPAIRIIIPRIPIIGLRINIDWLSDGWSFRSGHIGGVVTREEQCCLGDLGGLYTITTASMPISAPTNGTTITTIYGRCAFSRLLCRIRSFGEAG